MILVLFFLILGLSEGRGKLPAPGPASGITPALLRSSHVLFFFVDFPDFTPGHFNND